VPADNVPERPHWVITDLTEAAGDWYPRRPDWADVLAKGEVKDPSLGEKDLEALKEVVGTLRGIRISKAFRDFALDDRRPLGLWVKKPNCDFSGVPKASSFTADARPRWLDEAKAAPDDPVFTSAPGAAVFNLICVNCHGPAADSKGIQADAIMMMTGGDARVANLRDGLFGPLAQPGGNVARVFGAQAGATAEEWGARYLAWMALGGTQRRLPPGILAIVGTTQVLGEPRRASKFESREGTANMLTVAQELCRHVLPAVKPAVDLGGYVKHGTFDWGAATALIAKNGDAELWQELCSFENRPIVRVASADKWDAETTLGHVRLLPRTAFYWADAYPADAPVMDHRGRRALGVKPDNLLPLCVRRPTDAKQVEVAERLLAANPVGGPGGAVVPFCPQAVLDPKWQLKSELDEEQGENLIDVKRWATRGAINAGLAVYLYLGELAKGRGAPTRHTQCEAVKPR
jgi:mono/diheme cytochrome c family protein